MTCCKKNCLVAFFATFSALAAFAQKAPIKFGKIDESDLKMTVYPKDSAASAVILCDYGDAHVQYNKMIDAFEIVYYFHKRVKIFKADPSVLNNFGNIEIAYRNYGAKRQELITNLKAAVYTLDNGKITESKLDKSSIFDKEEFKHFFTKKFALPDVKDGVIIEYTYEMHSNLIYQPRTWYFQSDYPTKWSEYHFAFSQFHIYAYNQEGYNKLTINEKGTDAQTINFTEKIEPNSNRGLVNVPTLGKMENYNVTLNMTTNKWVMENVPALRGEAFITTPLDYYDKIEFQLNSIEPFNGTAIPFSNTWEKFVKDEIKEGTTGKKLRQRSAIKDLTKSLTTDKTEPMDKIAAISNYIKTNISTQSGFFLADDRSNEDVIQKKRARRGTSICCLGRCCQKRVLK